MKNELKIKLINALAKNAVESHLNEYIDAIIYVTDDAQTSEIPGGVYDAISDTLLSMRGEAHDKYFYNIGRDTTIDELNKRYAEFKKEYKAIDKAFKDFTYKLKI